jgi:hypothetical protein
MLYPLSYERWLEQYTAADTLTVRVARRMLVRTAVIERLIF